MEISCKHKGTGYTFANACRVAKNALPARSLGAFQLGRCQRWQQQCREDSEGGDHHQQFNQRKADAPPRRNGSFIQWLFSKHDSDSTLIRGIHLGNVPEI
jgi:hypothetical protein